ncbi:hypothetical protein [Rossellomorea aquimaris]|uniref:HNH endonuclease n=1 Tax=Rossellomorea aquimaris TaxID=189382 RepID=A0A5D4TN71_9BACI|nr:hypothetical protein [Rossellomorea aquimaris]TYS75922.1 hypothetical protein FZD05_19550 [Rossellomorea aquimaris]TYS81182.1 hypothetical protein FZC85_20125 [Rossellomorea aquimaris]
MSTLKACTDVNCRRKNQPLNIVTEFYAHKGGRYGRRAICKECYHKRYGKTEQIAKKKREFRLSLNNTLTEEEEELTMRDFEGKCALSGKTEGIELDHFVPLRWTEEALELGIGGTTFKNTIPLHTDLNKSKSSENPFEWISKARDRHSIDDLLWSKAVDYIASKNDMTVEEYKNKVNECHNIILAKEFVQAFLRRMKYKRIGILSSVIKGALEKGINIELAVERYGSTLVKNHFSSEEVCEEIKRLKRRMH